MQVSPRFERACEDRVEKPYNPKPSRAVNALTNSRSMPPRGLPKVSSLTRSPTTLMNPDFDLGLHDISIDDGTEGDLSDTVRSLRFSTAASTIDALFCRSPKSLPIEAISTKEEQDNGPQKPQNEKQNPPKDSNTDQTLPKLEKGSESKVTQLNTVEAIKKCLEVFETEPITPPPSEIKLSARGSRKFPQTKSLRTSITSNGETIEASIHSHSSHQRNTNTGDEVMPTLPSTPADTPETTQQSERNAASSGQGPEENNYVMSCDDKPRLRDIFQKMSFKSGEKGQNTEKDDSEPISNAQQANEGEWLKLLRAFKQKSTNPDKAEHIVNQQPVNLEETPPETSGKRPGIRKLLKKISSDSRDRTFAERMDQDTSPVDEEKPNAGNLTLENDSTQPNNQSGPNTAGQSKVLFQFLKRKSTKSAGKSSEKHQGEGAREEPDPLAENERPKLMKLLKKLSSGGRDQPNQDRMDEPQVHGDETGKRGGNILNLFKKKSSMAESEENKPNQASLEEKDCSADSPPPQATMEGNDCGLGNESSSSPHPDIRKGFKSFSEKVVRFLAMLVH